MPNPTDKELDAAVAKVLELEWTEWELHQGGGWWTGLDGAAVKTGSLHLDWNALMAALEKLTRNIKGNSFAVYQHDGFDACLYQCEIRIDGQNFSKCDGHSLSRVVALCIYAVVNQ